MFIFPCLLHISSLYYFFFFFNDTATTEIYTLSLHDALPICTARRRRSSCFGHEGIGELARGIDRKSTRLNSSHVRISYAVFCLKKKKKQRSMGAEFNEAVTTLDSPHNPYFGEGRWVIPDDSV